MAPVINESLCFVFFYTETDWAVKGKDMEKNPERNRHEEVLHAENKEMTDRWGER